MPAVGFRAEGQYIPGCPVEERRFENTVFDKVLERIVNKNSKVIDGAMRDADMLFEQVQHWRAIANRNGENAQHAVGENQRLLSKAWSDARTLEALNAQVKGLEEENRQLKRRLILRGKTTKTRRKK